MRQSSRADSTISQIGVTVSYHLPFPAQYSFQSDPAISLQSLTYEQTATLYNVAAVYAGLAASENRSDGEGIKRALVYLQVSHLSTWIR